MKKYYKEIDGRRTVKPASRITVYVEQIVKEEVEMIDSSGIPKKEIFERKRKEHIQNPTHEQILANGWTEYVTPVISEEELLERAKKAKAKKIDAHDTSSAVNEFFYGDRSFWLPRETRVSVRSTAQILKDSGHQTMTLWLGDVNVTLAPEEVLQMLTVLEVYALECYNTTAKHKANVNAFTDIKDVKAYDFTTNYPEKIHF